MSKEGTWGPPNVSAEYRMNTPSPRSWRASVEAGRRRRAAGRGEDRGPADFAIHATHQHKAFTLMELLLVMTSILILIGLSLPGFMKMAANARTVQCASNLRNIGGAVNAFVQDNGGNLPTSRESGDRTIMWTELLWSYVYSSKYVGYSGPDLPKSLAHTVFECPEAQNDRRSLPYITNVRSYGMNHYLGDYNEMTAEVRAAVANPETACLIADALNESQLRPYTINPRHNDTFNVLFVDGHVTAMALAPEMAEVKAHPFWGVVK